MRRSVLCFAITVTVLASREAEGNPLGDCLAAFPEIDVTNPSSHGSEEGFVEFMASGQYRKEVVRRLTRIQRAAAAGHLPSQYLHVTYFRGGEDIRPPIDGLLERNGPESWSIMERLAEKGFALAQHEVGMRAKDAGFFPPIDVMGRFDEDAAARSRKVFFEWMTRSALQGNRSAWESLADFYALQIEKFEGSTEDRVQGYAWTHLRAIPSRKSVAPEVWENNKAEAWARLRGTEEQEAAKALAARYEREVFPKLLKRDGPRGICRLEPQFAE